MRRPHVTFVIATYKRVDALRCTLRSLLLQTHTDWTALVIGDCCGDETAGAVRSLGEARIRYYNLPRRCGEQSGPNTAGLHLAEGDFVSFLNHDDLLLGDHLVVALGELLARNTDFYIGKFANATRLSMAESGALIPVFTQILPKSENLGLLVTHPGYFDPSSFWVIRTPYVRSVGPWRPAGSLWRSPLDDWLMRAWRLGGTFSFGRIVTGLRFCTHNLRTEGPLYVHATPENEYMVTRMERESPDATRLFLRRQIEEARRDGESAASPPGPVSFADAWHAPWQWSRSMVRRYYPKGLYLKLGIDPVNLAGRIRRRKRGAGIDLLSLRRTGERLPKQPSIEEFLRDPEGHRVL